MLPRANKTEKERPWALSGRLFTLLVRQHHRGAKA